MPHDEVLVTLDAEIAALTRGCLRAWTDSQKAQVRGDWDEVERLQDLADVLSVAADEAQHRLDLAISERVQPRHRVMTLVRV